MAAWFNRLREEGGGAEEGSNVIVLLLNPTLCLQERVQSCLRIKALSLCVSHMCRDQP